MRVTLSTLIFSVRTLFKLTVHCIETNLKLASLARPGMINHNPRIIAGLAQNNRSLIENCTLLSKLESVPPYTHQLFR